MRFYWLAWVACLSCLFMYFLGGQDQMNDVVASCQSKYQFIADGKEFVCIPSVEYFGDNYVN